MSVSGRDRKIIIIVVPLVVLLGYWFLLLAPKREQASTAGTSLAKQEKRLDAARAADADLGSAKSGFAADYTELVRLGKAVPTSVDMPSLIVQLESAARGTGIRFARIATGVRAPTVPAGSGAGAAPPAPGSGNGSQPAAAGGAPAKSGTGKAAENAGNNVQSSNDKSAAAEQSGVAPADAQTSASTGKGVPVGGGSAAAGSEQAPAAGGAGAPGLETVPLELEFQGGFFDLADFFHRLKRFVRMTKGQIDVRGRLVSIDGLKFSSDPEIFPRLRAEIEATAYLAPKAEGETAGATPEGPGAAEPQPATAGGGSGAPIAPTATATP